MCSDGFHTPRVIRLAPRVILEAFELRSRCIIRTDPFCKFLNYSAGAASILSAFISPFISRSGSIWLPRDSRAEERRARVGLSRGRYETSIYRVVINHVAFADFVI